MFKPDYYDYTRASKGDGLCVCISCKDSRAKNLQRAMERGIDLTRVLFVSVADHPCLATVENVAALVPRSAALLILEGVDYFLPAAERTIENAKRLLKEIRIGIPILDLQISAMMTSNETLQHIRLHSGNGQ